MRTTIALDTSVRDELQQRGRMGQSYEQVIRELLDATQEPQTRKQKNVEAPSRETAAPTSTIRDDQNG